jgi:protein TonB
MGSLVKKTQPGYPSISKNARDQGAVTLAALIGKDGRVHDLEVLASPSPELAASAMDAVKKWEYKPYLLNGEAVEADTIVTVIFRLGY